MTKLINRSVAEIYEETMRAPRVLNLNFYVYCTVHTQQDNYQVLQYSIGVRSPSHLDLYNICIVSTQRKFVSTEGCDFETDTGHWTLDTGHWTLDSKF
jgi:hypothetical protein